VTTRRGKSKNDIEDNSKKLFWNSVFLIEKEKGIEFGIVWCVESNRFPRKKGTNLCWVSATSRSLLDGKHPGGVVLKTKERTRRTRRIRVVWRCWRGVGLLLLPCPQCMPLESWLRLPPFLTLSPGTPPLFLQRVCACYLPTDWWRRHGQLARVCSAQLAPFTR
jgi:hypothetical protein